MTEAAYTAYAEAREEQLTRNEARLIRSKINDARNNPENAGRRWPFELLQNAHDTGPYIGRDSVQVSIISEQTPEGAKLIFEHDGAPFTLKELAALLSGGSSKEFESKETTGRFGTGFLVTHVLATRARVQGLLQSGSGLELFALTLERSGDEEAIINNIDSCNRAIRGAVPLPILAEEKSARFEYLLDNPTAVVVGLKVLRQALPYLFSTCPKLGTVILRDPAGVQESWVVQEERWDEHENRRIKDLLLLCQDQDGNESEWRSIGVSIRGDGSPGAIMVAQRSKGGWTVILPDHSFPRMFRRFPIQSYDLPIEYIVDAPFDVDQERQRVSLTENNKSLLVEALESIPVAIKFAYRENWEGKHLLAHIQAPPASAISVQEELSWWRKELTEVASAVAIMPVVESRSKLGPALGDDAVWTADFILPQLNSSSPEGEVSFERVWPLFDAIELYDPPEFGIAQDWTMIAKSWAELGLGTSLVALEDVAERLRKSADRLDGLPIIGDRHAWLATFLDVVGECWTKRQVEHAAALDGLLPDQLGQFRSHKQLLRDAGISEALKDIAATLGIEIRSQLLETKLAEAADAIGLTYFSDILSTLLPETLTEGGLIERCVGLLNQKLAEDKKAPDDIDLLEGSVKLLAHLWTIQGGSAGSVAKRCPLVASDGTVVRWSSTRMMMAPVVSWHQEAQPFSGAYPPQRILSTVYADGEESDVVSALVAWGMVIADPLTKDVPELKGKRLQGLASEGQSTEGITVSGVEFSYIALLHDAVILRCQESVEDAKLLLGLLLKYIAKHDEQWRQWRDVDGNKDRTRVSVRLRSALWVADLTTRAWVPVEGEEESSKAFAKAATLKDLLEPDWLINNEDGVALLSECFGFDSLESRLLGVEPDKRQEMRDGLARLVDIAKSDPATLSKFADEIEAHESRKRDIARWRRLGLAVQEAVKIALESHGLHVKVIDCGFDFEVLIKNDSEIEEADLARLEIGPYFLEVKATTQGEVKMTPAQAAHAAKNAERYALCVIDLRNFSEVELDREWGIEDIEPRSHLVTNIGTYASETTNLIEAAKGNEVGIRNESALRYGVPTTVWDRPISISQWVDSIAKTLG